MTFDSETESPASTVRRESEKRPDMPHSSESGEVRPAGALANSTDDGQVHSRASDGIDSVSDSNVIVRATCRIQLDLADMLLGKDERLQHFRRKCGGPEKCPACAAAHELRTLRNMAAKVANVDMRLRWMADSQLVQQYRIAEGREPRGKEWKEADFKPSIELMTAKMPAGERKLLLAECTKKDGQIYAYPLLRRLVPELASGIVANISRKIGKKWEQVRWNNLVLMTESVPHFSRTMPIPLRKNDVKITFVRKNRYNISFTIRAGRQEGRKKQFNFPIIARDEYMRRTLELICDDNAKMGEVSVSEDRLRPGRWYFRIAYKRKVDPARGVKTAGINKGMVAFLAAATEDGKKWIEDGNDIAAFLKQIQGRRKKYQWQLKVSMRGGHGRTRTLKPTEKLRDVYENWRNTKCQKIAKRFVDWLVREDVGRLYIDDFSGIRDTPPEKLKGERWIWERIQEWPYYKLQMAIISHCEQNGIETVIRSGRISSVCPRCGEKEQCKFDRRKLVCPSCKYRRHWDVSAAIINLKEGERERQSGQEPARKKTRNKSRAGRPKKGGVRRSPHMSLKSKPSKK